MNLKKLTIEIEKISQVYSKKYNINRDNNWHVLKLQEEMGELVQSYLMMVDQARLKHKSKKSIRKNFEHEVADVLCHILLLAKHFKIDVNKAIEEKWLKWKK